MNITFVTTAKTDEEGFALSEGLWSAIQECKKRLREYGKRINEKLVKLREPRW